MDQKKLFKQMLDFNKSVFENSFSAMVMLQDQAERAASTIIDQASWLPEDGRKAIQEWVDSYRKGQKDFKKLIDESYSRVESFFSETT
jgi:hypothetical protein